MSLVLRIYTKTTTRLQSIRFRTAVLAGDESPLRNCSGLVSDAYLVSRLLIAFIPSLPTRDPLILALTGVALVIVALVACYIPARRATRVDPLIALKSE